MSVNRLGSTAPAVQLLLTLHAAGCASAPSHSSNAEGYPRTAASISPPTASPATASSLAPPKDPYEEPHACIEDDVADCAEQCDRGDSGSCRSLAYLFMNGTSVRKDLTKAARLLLKACDGDDKAGCTSLGFMLRDSAGSPTNLRRAVALFGKACELNDAPACGALGYAHSEGQGADKDPTRALSLYTKACDLGDGASCFNAGQVNAEATGVPEDLKLAASFYRRGCDLDDASACTQLGFLYAKGQGGLAKNDGTAGLLFERACNAGEKVACANLRVLAREAAAPVQEIERRNAEVSLPGLFAKCMEVRSRIEKLRVSGVRAARSGDRQQADNAAAELKALEPEWGDTLEKINQRIEVVTNGAGGERDQERYVTLMRRFKACSCEPTPSGRCRGSAF